MVYILFHIEIMLNGLCRMCYAESLFQYNVRTGEESHASPVEGFMWELLLVAISQGLHMLCAVTEREM